MGPGWAWLGGERATGVASLVWGEGEDWASDPTAHWETRQTLPAHSQEAFLVLLMAPDAFHKDNNDPGSWTLRHKTCAKSTYLAPKMNFCMDHLSFPLCTVTTETGGLSAAHLIALTTPPHNRQYLGFVNKLMSF